MIRLSDHLTGADVKRVNLDLYRVGNYHGSSGRPSPRTMDAKDTEHRILGVREGDISRAIRALPPFADTEAAARSAWSHYLAIMCSRHFFPDANHRTSAITFSLALRHATGTACFLPDIVVADLVRQSKSVRDHDASGRRVHRQFTIEDVAAEEHQYRQVFKRFERQIVFVQPR